MPNAISYQGGTAVLDGFLKLADEWISQKTDDRGIAWFRGAVRDVTHAANERALGIAVGLVPRRLGKADLALPAAELARAGALRPGLDLSDWSIDQLARVALMAASHSGDEAAFASRFDSFCATAEINELIALCRGLPLYPNPVLIEPRAREAVRSGMKPVFEAVAHRNPYPRETFSEDAWNQMVVKAFFIGSTLWPIQGLDQRANPRLARMLVGLAQERWAAQRPVSGEVWRCIAPHADGEGVAALAHGWTTGNDRERWAIALALQMAPQIRIDLPADELAHLQARLISEKINWPDLA
ncbi:EboA domain-containing protein [Bradyrhizobium sp.]